MRFLAAEYKPIQNAIEASQIPLTDFEFVKKRGKLHVFHQKASAPFIFFRKTETILNAEKQWEKKVTYLLYQSGKGKLVESLEEMLLAFDLWLKKI